VQQATVYWQSETLRSFAQPWEEMNFGNLDKHGSRCNHRNISNFSNQGKHINPW